MRFLRQLVPRRGSFPKLRRGAGNLTMLRWASVPVTNRRWTAPLSAAALAMGLFVGVAISPRVSDTEGSPAAVVASTAPPQAAPILVPPVAGTPATTTPQAPDPADAPKPPKPPPLGGVPSSTPPIFPTPSTVTPAPPIVPSEPTTTTGDETTTTTEETTTEPLELAGTVAHVNPGARSYTLAAGDGALSAIHAKTLPKPGAKLDVRVRQLVNGTFAQQGQPKQRGTRGFVDVGGLVTWRDPGASRFTVSAEGVSALVVADGSFQIPNVGALVVVTAKIGPPEPSEPTSGEDQNAGPQTTTAEAPPTTTTTPDTTTPTPTPRAAPKKGCGVTRHQPAPPKTVLTATKIVVESEFAGSGDAEGIVQGVCSSKGELVISADDQRASKADVTLRLTEDSAIDLEAVRPGDVVDVALTIDEQSKRLDLAGLGLDGGAAEADDAALQQGG